MKTLLAVSLAALLLVPGTSMYLGKSIGLGISAPAEVAAASGCPSSSQRCIYVSPSGNDSSSGSRQAPLRSLSRARAIVQKFDRNMSGNITVYLEQGTYRLSQPLRLGAGDSGTHGHAVVWTAVPGQTAVISGATRVTGWKLSNKSRNIWAAPVARTLQTRQIYVNGMRSTLASGAAPVKLTRTRTGYTASSAAMSHWRDPSAIEFVYTAQLGLMVEPICPVATIIGRTITMAQPCWNNSTKRPANHVGFGTLTTPSYIQNAYELLDEPGQFYLDHTAHMLYYIPRQGESMRTADVEVPAVQTLLTGAGSPGTPIHNVTFANLQFSYATWLQPGTVQGFSEIQSNFTLTGNRAYNTQGLCHLAPHGTCPFGAWTKEPGNVQFSYDDHLSFANDRFVHLGAAGLNLDNGSQNATIAGSVFTDISGNGIEIGNVNLPDAARGFQTENIKITDDHLYGMPVEFHGGVDVLVGYAANSVISHNQIDHVPYSAVSVGWGGWPDKVRQPPWLTLATTMSCLTTSSLTICKC